MKWEDERLVHSEERMLSMPSTKGPFSGKGEAKVEYFGEDFYQVEEGEPAYGPIYSEDALKWIKKDFEIALRNEHDKVVAITGPEGFGKSTLSIKIAKILDPDFPLENIVFGRDELTERLKTIDDGGILIVDEAGVTMFAQEWWQEMQRDVVKKLTSGRIKGLRIFFNVPHKNMLNNQIRNRRLDAWFRTMRLGRYMRGEAQIREPIDNPWDLNPYWDIRFTLRFGAFKGNFWDEYVEKKTKWVDTHWGSDSEHLTRQQKELRARLYGEIKKQRDEGLSYRELADRFNYSKSNVWQIVDKVEDNPDLIKV